ncbi:MAG: META domain-containing protein [Verrucomicrobiales bacterium]|nr:META domain-containing protein [Verrucomicrobiales bacterium]
MSSNSFLSAGNRIPRWAFLTSAAAAAALLLSGCASHEGATSTPAKRKYTPATAEALAPFRDVDLHLERLVSAGQSIPLPAATPITIRLGAGGRIAGKSSVNRFFGTYQMEPDGTLKWPNAALGLTRMAGPQDAMDLESKFTSSLAASQKLLVASDAVRFESNDGSHIAEFRK